MVFSKLLENIKNNEEVEIVTTMLSAHFTFLLAELITETVSFLPISGVIATVVASIMIGNYGKYKITPKVEHVMEKFWSFFAFVSNSIVFILIGLILSDLTLDFQSFAPVIFLGIVLTMIARAVSVYLPI